MRLALLASPDSWYLQDLRRAAGSRHEIIQATYRELLWSWSPNDSPPLQIFSGTTNLLHCDALIVRTMPPGSLEQIVARMDILSLLPTDYPVINPVRAIETAVDKGLCTARLARAGIPVPRTIVAQTVSQALASWSEFPTGVVVKPLFGSEGRGIALLHDPAIAERTFQLWVQAGAVLYLQEFIPHGNCDYRVLIVGDNHWCMKRTHESDWRTNLSRGAMGERCELPTAWIDLSRQAAQVIGAPLAGVDLLVSETGEVYVIEVNAVPGWRGLSAALEVDIAAEVLSYVAAQVNK